MNNRIWIYLMSLLIGVLGKLVTSVPIIREVRYSVADAVSAYSNYEPAGPGSYAFGYDIDDQETENTQFRDEERLSNGTVIGKYGWVAADGTAYMVSYVADAKGYRADVKNIPNYKLYRRVTPSRYTY